METRVAGKKEKNYEYHYFCVLLLLRLMITLHYYVTLLLAIFVQGTLNHMHRSRV